MAPIILSVAEKPSVAKELANIIASNGPIDRRPGYSPFNQVFEIRQCQFKGSPASMKITSVTGHLMEKEFQAPYCTWGGCQPIDLFHAPIVKRVKKENENIKKTLVEEAKKCQILMLWLDCDLEGENIAYEVIQVCKEANTRLDIYRARFSALIPRDIMRTLQHPERPNPDYNDAVEARQEIDLRIGAAFTRFQTKKLQNKYTEIENALISYGPCQFPTLGFVVDRYHKIEQFRPQSYWIIKCEYDAIDNNNSSSSTMNKSKKENCNDDIEEDEDEGEDDDINNENSNLSYTSKNTRKKAKVNTKNQSNKQKSKTYTHCNFTWERGHIYDHFTCLMYYDLCFYHPESTVNSITNIITNNNIQIYTPNNAIYNTTTAKVIKCDQKPTSRQRPCPLNTIELQKRASTSLRLSSERTMQIAESLYQRGILSYPRTETDFFKEGFDLMTLLNEHRTHSLWGTYVTNLLDIPQKFQWPRNGGHDDQAHPPIHPTKCIELTDLTDDSEKAIYELVTRHFLACCSEDGKGSLTTVRIQIPADENHLHHEYFTTSGLMIIEKNWLEVYSKFESWHANKIPLFKVGDIFTPTSLIIQKSETAPPLPLSESELISNMDKNGIGTDATIATHISTIQQREYVIKDPSNRFIPTKLGLALIEAYNNMGYQLNKPYLRASMEKDCQKIARGELKKQDVIQNIIQQMKLCFETCIQESNKLDTAMIKYFQKIQINSMNYTVYKTKFTKCGSCNSFMDYKIKDNTNDTTNTNNNNNNNNNNNTSTNNGRNKRRPTLDFKLPIDRILACETCHKTHSLPLRGEITPHDILCAICHYQVITIRNVESNKEHTVCPYCFKNAPPPPIGEIESDNFRCLSCAHPTCTLAGKIPGEDIDITLCSEIRCTGTMRLKKIKTGYIICCQSTTNNSNSNNNNSRNQNQCTNKWWLPKCIKTAVPMSTNCTKCSTEANIEVKLLHITLNLSTAPPGLPPNCDVCPSCDPLWMTLHISGLSRRAIGIGSRDMRTPMRAGGGVQSMSSSMGQYTNTVSNQSLLTYGPITTTTTTATTNTATTTSNNGNGVSNISSTYNSININNNYNHPTSSSSSSSSSSSTSSSSTYDTRMNGSSAVTTYSNNQPNTTISNNNNNNNSNSNTYMINNTDNMRSFSSSLNTSYINSSNNNIDNIDISEYPLCSCNISCRILTTTKDGANKGRKFFICTKSATEKCNYFKWVDEYTPNISNIAPNTSNRSFNNNTYGNTPQTSSTTPYSNNNNSNYYNNNHENTRNDLYNSPRNNVTSYNSYNNNSNIINTTTCTPPGSKICTCNLPAKLCTVQKEGPNKGRKFYGCPQPRDNACKYFEWADE